MCGEDSNLDHSLRSLLPSSGSGGTCSHLWRAPVSRRRPDRPEPAEWMKKEQPSRNCIKETVYQTGNYLHLKIFIPPISSEKKNKMVFSQFFPLSNWNNDFSFSLTGGLLWMKKYIFYASAPGLQVKHHYSWNEAWQYEVQTVLQPRYDACEQCWSWFVIIYTSMSPALAACSRKPMAVFSSSVLCCPLLDRSSFAWRYCACLWPPTAACQ